MSAPPEDCLTWQRRAGEWLVGGLMEAIWGVRVSGLERVPRTGPLIVACNHVSLADPNLIGWAIKDARKPRYLAKAELFRNPLTNWVFTTSGCIPLERKSADIGAMRAALCVLQSGGSLFIFPEGTRVKPGESRAPKPGVAYLAASANAPVLPARVLGTDRFPRAFPLEVRFGAPLPPPPQGREHAAPFAAKVMEAVYAL